MDIEVTNISLNDGRLENIIKSLSKWKTQFVSEREECKKLREVNAKLEFELKEVREGEKSHRYHLLTSREMIGNLQETVSQLVYLKKEAKKLKDDIMFRDKTISAMEKDRESISENHRKHFMELRETHEKDIEELKNHNETTVKQLQYESDTQIAQFTCTIEELRNKLREMETEHKEKINVVVLEYEEKFQRSEFQVTQLQEQLARETARADANIDAYRRRLEELEEKLKQTQFKHYLAHTTYPSQYESQVERPYSVERDYAEPNFANLDSTVEATKRKGVPASSQNKTPRTNTLQVMYYGTNSNTWKAAEKKGSFHITKKRKLYNEKDFINM